MALGGFNAGTLDNSVPANSESVGLGAARIRSVKTNEQQALDSEHVWPAAGGIIGQHRAGSARAFYGPASQLSASDTSTVANGRTMVTSDTTRLFSVNSLGASLLGAGPGSLSIDTTAGMTFNPQNCRWVMEMGVTSMGSSIIVTFPNSGFSGIPFLYASIFTLPAGGAPGDAARLWKLASLTASGFSAQIVDSTNNVSRNDAGLMWMSVGTRAV